MDNKTTKTPDARSKYLPTETCPTCGSAVRVEGRTTKYYVPVGWIKREDQEPPRDGRAIVAFHPAEDRTPYVMRWSDLGQFWYNAHNLGHLKRDFTHWLPLPPLPRGDE